MADVRTTVYAGKRPRRTSRASAIMRPPHVGDALGPYRLCVEIGGGGMAVVYLAQVARPGAHRFVALKCIRPELARNPRFVDMFLDEARVAAHIHHPNVCSVLDFDAHHGTYYLAMELLAGQTLTAIQHELKASHDAGDPIVRAGLFARVLEAACEGLHAAHETTNDAGESLDIVHRDVSPDNLFVTYDGNVKVMDFGVASSTQQHDRTRTGVLKGKCSYLAPEVIAGAKPDRRADVWGLGVVAWELVTQRKLFDQPNEPAVLHAIAEHAVPPPSKVRDGLPKLIDDIVLRALERDPAHRYPTARELGRMLNRFIVEHRLVVGPADIAEHMRAFFPEGVACARQLVRFAEQLEAVPARRSSPPMRESVTVADASAVRALARRSATIDSARGSDPGTVHTHAPPRRRWRWLVAAVAGAAIGSGVVVACQLRTDAQATTPIAADPPPTSFTLEASPAGVDASGAILLRVRVVRKP
jgi:serine/threonine-protein kinase